MRSATELQALYEEELKPKLEKLEAERGAIKNGTLLIIFIVLLGIIVTASLFEKSKSIVIFGILVAVFAIYKGIKVWGKYVEYRGKYKEGIVRKVVSVIDPEWQYYPESYISTGEYYQSGIFTKRHDRYKGDDLVEGLLGKTDFRCSEIHSEYKQVTTDSKGRRQEHWVTIFKGLFMHADFNKEIRGKTFVLPDTAEKAFGRLGTFFQKFDGHGKLIKLENIEFEKYFAVYGEDQIESRYILTPAIMEAMTEMRKRFHRKVYFSFVGSRVFCAISFTKDLFEPRIFKSGVRYTDIEEIFSIFGMIQIIIDELNLNTRIWTKE